MIDDWVMRVFQQDINSRLLISLRKREASVNNIINKNWKEGTTDRQVLVIRDKIKWDINILLQSMKNE